MSKNKKITQKQSIKKIQIIQKLRNTSQNISKKDQPNLYNTIFKWNFGGSTVYVTGTFTNWINHVQLQKQGQEFSVCVKLPPDVYQYKFIVDGEWRFSPDDNQSTDENGNINNIIDTTKIKQVNYLQETHQRPVPPVELKNKKDDMQKVENQFKKIGLDDKSPNISEFSSEKFAINERKKILPEYNFTERAPPCPPHLHDIYFLRQKERKHFNIWKQRQIPENLSEEQLKKMLKQEENEVLIHIFEGDHQLAPPLHVTTKHVGIKQRKKPQYHTYSLTQRFKQKYTTYKFYTNQYFENSDRLFVS
ncbi:hypothetical protein IMG5_188500 [Ichthyophthirius multifiliis]|uniref:AMP-activated protein kinase glycogen-binding domain-containing protein n=1 Tax=Ichthyophthirius multifiliis TaxID=5932 RepID=G0R3Z3_ICHMU|nr:hypothetical protein IMG5_188500 [Ichthyophthirius multifiliis]EGR27824.1 hypothetical protein IMG5_188500 [Ichthyophthirius multifiliis]|eukprot:XP_004027169.1 hypothetical protein IMG5_188500 [Ichthyophthirius multifiliis]